MRVLNPCVRGCPKIIWGSCVLSDGDLVDRLPEVSFSHLDAEAQHSCRLDLDRFHVGHVHRDVERQLVDVLADVSRGFLKFHV